MVYVFAVAAGLCVAALLVVAGAAGYAIALAPGDRKPLLGLLAGTVLVVGVTGALLASVVYTRVSTVAVVRVAGNASQASPSASTSSEPQGTPAEFQPATDAWLHFESDTGDYVGGGVLKIWTLKESDFSIGGTNSMLQVNVSGLGDWWTLFFRAPSNGHLVPGLFSGAERAAFVTGKAPGLDVSGDGRGCNTVNGRFQIKSLNWTTAATVAQIDVLFEQHCEGMTPALRGELWMTTQLGVHRAPPPASSTITF